MWGAAMDVGEWLRNLGLDKYETAFREHAIDMHMLAELTDGELAQIGVPLGDRKRLLKAISSLSKTEPSPSSKEGAPPAQAIPLVPLGAGRDAERRPITVMFCDLVGSTALASRLDAEDWRSLVNAYLDEASGAVNRLGGHVLKRLGDGLMALFGYPHAQENDAERAVRAALAIQRALVELNARNAAKGALDRERRPHRAFGVVLLRMRIAEERHQPIAEPLQHMPAKPGHRGGGFVEIGVDEAAPVLRVEPRRERRRTDEVAEHDRDRAALGQSRSRGCRARRVGRDRFGCCRGRRRPCEARDRLEQSFAVAERQSELREIALSEIGEHVRVDRVVAKGGLVAAEAETAKPPADVHGRASHRSAA